MRRRARGRARPRRRAAAWGAALALTAVTAAAAAAGVALYAERKLSRLVAGGLGVAFSGRVYAAPFRLDARSRLPPGRLMLKLERLGYRRVRSGPRPGQYAWDPPRLVVNLRGFSLPHASQEPGPRVLEHGTGGSWSARGPDGPERVVLLEPEAVAELSGPDKVRREPASWEEFPEALRRAVVAAEDRRFFSHPGLDAAAILRAAGADAAGGRIVQGGSTITQQLAKNLFLDPRRTWRRKAAEAVLALYLEARYNKERILTLYLNHIYWGQDGAVGVAGAKAAAGFYFGKPLSRLDAADCALLAALIRSPYRYNPWRHPEAARARRDHVLETMAADGALTPAGLGEARSKPLRVRRGASVRGGDAAYYVAEVLRRLMPAYGEEGLFRLGLQVHTAMDPDEQAAAQDVLRRGRRQGALVALDPEGGGVRALAGGRDFAASPFNRATQARRQPGSAFKPFVYAAALERGFTPASLLADEPRAYTAGEGKSWTPRNFDGVYRGTTTLRQSLAQSLNAATVDLAARLGPETAASFARRLGLEAGVPATLATALGASETTLLELTAAYAPFANGGFRVEPRLIEAVLDHEGRVLEAPRPVRDPVLDPALAALITSLLEDALREGTGTPLKSLGWTRPAAGKTGTTNGGRDAWFVGYVPGLVAGAWVGDDRNRALGLTGARDALPVWAAFMARVLGEREARPLASREVLSVRRVDPASGLLAHAGCPGAREEWFVPGTEPTERCRLHREGLFGWLKRLIGIRARNP